MGNKIKLNNSIRNAISNSRYSDAKLATLIGVGRDTIFRWRTGTTKIIRKQNLIKLAKKLNQNIRYTNNGIVEFIPQNPDNKDTIPNELKNFTGEEMASLIQTMQKQIEYLLQENSELKSQLKSLPEKKS
jgi:transcriptional regulator with XRE-family HTH domain